jgi:hypothetical protein
VVRRFVHFEVLCTAEYRYGENFFTVKNISVREICQQRINNHLQTIFERGKIARPVQRYLFISGLPNFGILPLKTKKQMLGSF